MKTCRAWDEFEKRSIEKGKIQGKTEGKTEGALEKEKDNIKTMHKNGFDIETIAKALSLDINYVKEVLSN
jgi:predicted transposase/invertase (TIGR01784 family)